ncbi:hypothetical protein IB265_33080 [Ensifer sp. ENS10]|uniref:hypothetical protein n=1 Tax=Ensifer sp. ENS10 TaxID=2769286 RepID=UPI00178668A3|nr:hypothetical protein [Ensifer sp. ENS10]MBD9511592.1 hypothetical protein [Ensifer sp. ENS10]
MTQKIKIMGYECEVSHISDYARGPDGTCAFCKGDPCLEDKESTGPTAMQQYDADGKWWDACPCCEGRPT